MQYTSIALKDILTATEFTVSELIVRTFLVLYLLYQNFSYSRDINIEVSYLFLAMWNDRVPRQLIRHSRCQYRLLLL